MEVRELRIGNYVTDNCTSSDIYEICRLETPEFTNWNSGDEYSVVGTILGEEINSCYDIKPIPIPLTEEWLLKFGFEKDSTGWYSKNDLGLKKNGDYFEDYYYFRKLKHVHNLQNFYKECKGEELTLKKDEK